MKNSSSPLVAVPMVDKNGKTVTRWTRLLETGEPEVNIPAPKSPALNQMAETVFARLFPDIEEESGYLIDAMGARWFQSYEFCSHAISLLPPTTLKDLIAKYDYNRSAVQRHLTKSLINYVGAMYEHGQAEDASDHYAKHVAGINNALVFFEPLNTIIPLEKYAPADDDIPDLINWGVQYYEDDRIRVNKHTYYAVPTPVDYGALPRRKRDEAKAFFLAMYLNQRCGNENERPDPELVKLISENMDRQEEIRDLALERSTKNVPLLRNLLNGGEVSALSGGEL